MAAADEQPSGLHIDTDWKKQAQEEKRRLAEEEQKRAAERERAATPPPGMGIGAAGPASAGTAGTAGAARAAGTVAPSRGRAGSPAGASRERAVPEASMAT